MPTFDLQTCAPSHQATPMPIPDSVPSHDVCSYRLTVPILWERLSVDLCVGGAPPSSPLTGVAMGPPLTRLRRCAAAATARTRAPSAPSCLLPSDHVGSIHAHRHLRARSGARLRLRCDGPRPGRLHGRHRRLHRRLLLQQARPLERGAPHALKVPVCTCGRVHGHCAAGCRRCRLHTARASRPRRPQLTASFAASSQAPALSQRCRRAQIQPAVEGMALTSAATCAAASSDGFLPTAHGLGAIPAASAASTGLSTTRCARFSQVSGACEKTPRVRVCGHVLGRCTAGCRRRASRASRPRHQPLTPTRQPRCRRSQRHRSAVAPRRSGRPWGLPSGPGVPQRPPHARAGGRRWSRRLRHVLPRAWDARGALGCRRGLRMGASRAAVVLRISVRSRGCEVETPLGRLAAPRRLQAGWAWPGGGPWTRWGRAERQRRTWHAVVVARTHSEHMRAMSKKSRSSEIVSRVHFRVRA